MAVKGECRGFLGALDHTRVSSHMTLAPAKAGDGRASKKGMRPWNPSTFCDCVCTNCGHMQSAQRSSPVVKRLISSRIARIESIKSTMRTGSWVVGSARGTGAWPNAKNRELLSKQPPVRLPLSPAVRCDLPLGTVQRSVQSERKLAVLFLRPLALSPRPLGTPLHPSPPKTLRPSPPSTPPTAHVEP